MNYKPYTSQRSPQHDFHRKLTLYFLLLSNWSNLFDIYGNSRTFTF